MVNIVLFMEIIINSDITIFIKVGMKNEDLGNCYLRGFKKKIKMIKFFFVVKRIINIWI